MLGRLFSVESSTGWDLAGPILRGRESLWGWLGLWDLVMLLEREWTEDRIGLRERDALLGCDPGVSV